jgi:molecular chaperone IbpA
MMACMTPFRIKPAAGLEAGLEMLAKCLEMPVTWPKDRFPPCDIERLEGGNVRLSMAVAGFKREQIDITQQGDVLTIAGKTAPSAGGQEKAEILYQGIARRPFEHRFRLGEHVSVASVTLADGMLQVNLQQSIPEEAKPRRIEILPAA